MAASHSGHWGTIIKWGVFAVVIYFIWTWWQNFVHQQDIYAIGGQQVSSPPAITNNWYGWANPGGTSSSSSSAPTGGGNGGLVNPISGPVYFQPGYGSRYPRPQPVGPAYPFGGLNL